MTIDQRNATATAARCGSCGILARFPYMDSAQVLAQLSDHRSSWELLDAPAASGVYAFFLCDGVLPGVHCAAGGCLYIGLSSNLAQREFDTHFRAGRSGFSTLRRSLGALLIDDLQLQPEPRSAGNSDTNYRNYRFDAGGEERLSAWMQRHLDIGVYPEADPKPLERELIELAGPPLNLTHWPNPDAPLIRAARKRCVDAARARRRQ
ncbi:GIY-YIG nuclease family protein [Mycolicibacter senuensis]|nr:hypothetical protein [Mycolicibacter senuensis]